MFVSRVFTPSHMHTIDHLAFLVPCGPCLPCHSARNKAVGGRHRRGGHVRTGPSTAGGGPPSRVAFLPTAAALPAPRAQSLSSFVTLTSHALRSPWRPMRPLVASDIVRESFAHYLARQCRCFSSRSAVASWCKLHVKVEINRELGGMCSREALAARLAT